MSPSKTRTSRGGSGSNAAASAGSNAAAGTPALHLSRWTITSGSNVRSRGAVVIEAGDHHWQASADGNGAVDALLRAVDEALHDVLAGHPRLVSYDVHAVAEGPDAEGLVSVELMPPAGAEGARGTGRYAGQAQSTNIIAASIEAYIEALNTMLDEAHWAGAAESAGRGRRAKAQPHGRRGEFDREKAEHDTTNWFER
ncbi:MAG TPA: alpha-isopropylmalate synthase regulatory domain-containing protein [Candidatus Eisenbacteria bacterium]|nr:alpha-isopropylmalate synthase regulatory domain-containing protein [Candidatus Eisenbacteria bacterium]